MANLLNLSCRDDEGSYNVVVEVPRHSRLKLKYDPPRGVFILERALLLGVAYPYDWGFFPSTVADDGDPLDAMVLFDAPTWPGVVIPVRPIGLVRVTQKERGKRGRTRNDRIIAVPAADRRYAKVRTVPERVQKELEEFFLAASRMQKKDVRIEGWSGARAARAAIHQAARKYARQRAS